MRASVEVKSSRLYLAGYVHTAICYVPRAGRPETLSEISRGRPDSTHLCCLMLGIPVIRKINI